MIDWPVGQVVKTAASHAVNIGSNPVRVTKNSLDRGLEKVYNLVCSPVIPDNIELVKPYLRSQTSEAFGKEDEERRSERALAARAKRRIRSPRRVSWC